MKDSNNLKFKFWFSQVFGTLLFIVGLISCYQGALKELPWLGMLVVGVVLISDLLLNRRALISRLKLIAIIGTMGFLLETAMILSSVYSIQHSGWLFTDKIIPIWMFALWLNFGIRVPAYLIFFRGRHITNVIIGLAFALMIFSSASHLGLVRLNYGMISMVIIATGWGILIPIIYLIADKLFPVLSLTKS
jgi:hypothetical protein